MRTLLAMVTGVTTWVLRALGWTAAIAMAGVAALFVGWMVLGRGETEQTDVAEARPAFVEPYAGETYVQRADTGPGAIPRDPGACDGPASFNAAADANARSLNSLVWKPFRIEEIGWEIYGPLIAAEIGSDCGFGEPGFAAALANWQRRKGLRPDGVVSVAAFGVMQQAWHRRRPFSRVRPENCPIPPSPESLETASAGESYGRLAQLRPGPLAAYRRMISAARAEAPEIFRQPDALKIFSAWRDPEADEARCLVDGACDGVRRTHCSAHRTGLAMDIYVGMAPGGDPASTQAFNRLAQSKTPAYRWMVRNAGRFGFVNYAFEPWHWEWTGEPI
jgi:zinc D-Ala-D-Ala carboxypeptidase